jgi:hypothetical protein
MNAKAIVFTVVAIVISIALASAWLDHRYVKQRENELSEMDKKLPTIDLRMRRAKEQIMASERTQSSLDLELKQLRAHKRASKQNSLAMIRANNPTVHALFLKSYRARLALVYQPLYNALGLPQPQIEKLEDLMATNQEQRMDITAAAGSQGMDASDPAISSLQMQNNDQLHTGEIAILGQDGYQQLQQFERTQAIGPLIQDVSSIVAYGPHPITASQVTDLNSILTNASTSYQSGGNADPQTIDWSQALGSAQELLSEPQFAALKTESQFLEVQAMVKQFYQSQTGPK